MTNTTKLIEQGTSLPLIEEFYTLQGEGQHAGKAAYFIRLGGCDIGCKWCDTKFSWVQNLHDVTTIEQILQSIQKTNADTIVITGGEPLSYNLAPLCQLFKTNGYKIHLETSGCYPTTGEFDWYCLSPKKHNLPEAANFEYAHELKIIVFDESDFVFAEECSSKVSSTCKLFLQPEWSHHKELIPIIVNYILNHPKWEISLQMHKFMHIP